MNIWAPQAIQYFLLLFVPGFVSFKVYDLLIAGERRDFTKTIPEAVGLSAFFFAIYYLIILFFQINFASISILWLLAFLFFFPALAAYLWVKFTRSDVFTRNIRNLTPTAWDHIFEKKASYWVIIHLSDGRKIGGLYSEQSFATVYPAEPQIYLEEVWKLDEDGKFDKKVERSAGIVVLGKEIFSIEFFKGE
ncbi:MAG: hypothetical protein HQL97_03110 [Magnetococcales bacterium]|nr:hypothetical protein [Magnetococcales bacterium]MBF0260819.1 hypothetical protein [Magnetococcales bacterium]